jgi:hypothetical protein
LKHAGVKREQAICQLALRIRE